MTAGAPPDWYDIGWTDYLEGKHMPDRKCRLYPTRDRHSAEDERQFLAGWRAAKAADEGMAGDMTELENVPC